MLKTKYIIMEFVKVKNNYYNIKYNEWFLLFDSPEMKGEFNENINERKLVGYFGGNYHGNLQSKIKSFEEQYAFSPNLLDRTFNADYNALYEKYKRILLIRESGSYMFLDEDIEIYDTIFSEHFPIDDYGDIVICENDYKREWFWQDYLNKRFPNKTIKTINFFKTRELSYIKEVFEKAEYITFSTTFSEFEWFEKMVQCLNEKHKVIGLSHDESKWNEILKIYNDLEIVYKKDLQK